jgi:hypothetical protein
MVMMVRPTASTSVVPNLAVGGLPGRDGPLVIENPLFVGLAHGSPAVTLYGDQGPVC